MLYCLMNETKQHGFCLMYETTGERRQKTWVFVFSGGSRSCREGDAECREARGLDVDRAARGAYHVRTEWCPDDGGDPGDGNLLYVAFKAFACAGGGEPGGVVAASCKVSVLRAWDAEALGSMPGVSSGAGAAAAGGCGALPRVRAGV